MTAQTITSPPSSLTACQFLLFKQDSSLFAIQITAVREVFTVSEQALAPVPNTPFFVLGLMNLRGEIIPVADFGYFINVKPVNRKSREGRILILETEDSRAQHILPMRIGLAVSGIEGVVNLYLENIASAAEVSRELAPILKGLYDLEGRLIMILDVETIAFAKDW